MGRKEVFTPTDSDTDEGHDPSDDAVPVSIAELRAKEVDARKRWKRLSSTSDTPWRSEAVGPSTTPSPTEPEPALPSEDEGKKEKEDKDDPEESVTTGYQEDWTPTTSICGSPHSQRFPVQPVSINSITEATRDDNGFPSSEGPPTLVGTVGFEVESPVEPCSDIHKTAWPPLSPSSDKLKEVDAWEDIEDDAASPTPIFKSKEKEFQARYEAIMRTHEEEQAKLDMEEPKIEEKGTLVSLASNPNGIADEWDKLVPAHRRSKVTGNPLAVTPTSSPSYKGSARSSINTDSLPVTPTSATSFEEKKEVQPLRPDTPAPKVPALFRYKEFKKNLKTMREAKRREEREKELAQMPAVTDIPTPAKTPEKKAKTESRKEKAKKEKAAKKETMVTNEKKSLDEKFHTVRERRAAMATKYPARPSEGIPEWASAVFTGIIVIFIFFGMLYLLELFRERQPKHGTCRDEVKKALSAASATFHPQKVNISFETLPCSEILVQDPDNKEDLFFIQFDTMCVTLSRGAKLYWAPEFEMKDKCGTDWEECEEGRLDRKMELRLPRIEGVKEGGAGDDADSTLEALRKADEILVARIAEYNMAREESVKESRELEAVVEGIRMEKDQLEALKEELRQKQEEFEKQRKNADTPPTKHTLSLPEIGPLFDLSYLPDMKLVPLQPKHCNPWSFRLNPKLGDFIERRCYEPDNKDCFIVISNQHGSEVEEKRILQAKDKSKHYEVADHGYRVHICNSDRQAWSDDGINGREIFMLDVQRWVELGLDISDHSYTSKYLTKDQILIQMWLLAKANKELARRKKELGKVTFSDEESWKIVETQMQDWSEKMKNDGFTDEYGRWKSMEAQDEWKKALYAEERRKLEEAERQKQPLALSPEQKSDAEVIKKLTKEILHELILEGLIDPSGQAARLKKSTETQGSSDQAAIRSSILEDLASNKEDTTYVKSAHQLTSSTDSIRFDGSTKPSRWTTSGTYAFLHAKYKQMGDILKKEKEKSRERLAEMRRARVEKKAEKQLEETIKKNEGFRAEKIGKRSRKEERKARKEDRKRRVKKEWENVSRRLRGEENDLSMEEGQQKQQQEEYQEENHHQEEDDQEKGFIPCFLRQSFQSRLEVRNYRSCIKSFFGEKDNKNTRETLHGRLVDKMRRRDFKLTDHARFVVDVAADEVRRLVPEFDI